MSSNNDSPIALKIDLTELGQNSILQISIESDKYPIKEVVQLAHPSLDRSMLATRVVTLHGKLRKWAEEYNKYLLDPDKDRFTCGIKPGAKSAGLDIWDVWRELAKWGRVLYRDLFADGMNEKKFRGVAELNEVARGLEKYLTDNDRIVFDSPLPINVAWGFLYPDDVPETGKFDVDKFWGVKYRIESSRYYSKDSRLFQNVEDSPVLKNNEKTRLTVTINRRADVDFKTNQDAFFQSVKEKYRFSVEDDARSARFMRLNYKRQDVIESLLDPKEPQHLYYFFCHHKRLDGQPDPIGFDKYYNSLLIIEGNEKSTDGAISWDELRANDNIVGFKKSPPVFVLNACESIQQTASIDGFLHYFTKYLDVLALVGTHAKLPAAVADLFGSHFVEEFLGGKPIGQILNDFARLLVKDQNPFGLYYSLFGDGGIKLAESISE